MARGSVGPRRLSNVGWFRYRLRRTHRIATAITTGSEAIMDQIELAYKTAFDAGWKAKARADSVVHGEVLEAAGRSQRHQDFVTLVMVACQPFNMTQRTVAVAIAMEHEPPADYPLERYAVGLVQWLAGEYGLPADHGRPAWLPPDVIGIPRDEDESEDPS